MNLNLTILGQAIAFALFVWFCLKYVWPPLIGALRDRQQKIADGLEAAAKSQRDLDKAEQLLQQKIDEGRKRAQELIGEAEKHSQLIIEEARTAATEEQNRIRKSAEEQLHAEANRVREELRADLAALVIEGVEAILKKEVDAKTHDDYLKQITARL